VRRTWAVAVAVLGLLLMQLPATATAQVPAAASSATLRGTTSIQWTGKAGVTLRVPQPVTLAGGDVDLTLTGGTYAFVRLITRVPSSGCPVASGKYCDSWSFSLIRDVTDAYPGVEPPARRHYSLVGIPTRWDYKTMDAYLLTDGAARLTMRFEKLAGSVSITAAGHVRATVRRLLSDCLPVRCANQPGPADVTAFGGVRVDVGASGWSDVLAWTTSSSPTPVVRNNARTVDVCLYPRGGTLAKASSDPSRYRWGCVPVDDNGLPPPSPQVATWNGLGPGPYSLAASWTYWSEARGGQYLGFRSLAAPELAPESDAFGVWITYGIR